MFVPVVLTTRLHPLYNLINATDCADEVAGLWAGEGLSLGVISMSNQ
jgi:hypothetical protein